MKQKQTKWLKIGVLATLVIIIAGIYVLTPVSKYMEVEKLTTLLEKVPKNWSTFFVFLGSFFLGGVLLAPIPLLAFAASLVFGIWKGTLISIIGIALASTSGYVLGLFLDVDIFGEFVSKHLKNFKKKIGDKGAWAVLGLRVAPTPPFTVTSILSGSIGLDYTKYLLGSVIGIMPLALSAIFFGKSALLMMKNPSGIAATGLVAAIILYCVYLYAKKRLKKKSNNN